MIRLLKFFWWSGVAIFCAALLSFSGAYLYLSPSLPSVESLRSIQLQIPLRVYSHDQKLIAEFGEMRRAPIAFADIPEDFIAALLSAESRAAIKSSGMSAKAMGARRISPNSAISF